MLLMNKFVYIIIIIITIGVLDFAGGNVVHISSGKAVLIALSLSLSLSISIIVYILILNHPILLYILL